MKYILSFAILFFGIFSQVQAQKADKFFKKVNQIEELAKKGTGDADPKALIKAVKLLLKNPMIRPLNHEKKTVEEDYFNPYSLLELAELYAKNKPRLLRKTKKLYAKLKAREPDIRKQDPSPKNVRIPSTDYIFFEKDKEKIQMSFQARESQHVIIEFQLGQNIGISVVDSQIPEKTIAKGVGEEVKRMHFNIEKGQWYNLELFNNTGETALLRLAW